MRTASVHPHLPLGLLAALAITQPALGQGLNVDFGTSWGTPASSYGAASGQVGDWNEIGLGVAALVDVTGAASGVSVSVTATTTGNASSDGSDGARLLADNFYAQNSSWSADLSGLAPGGGTECSSTRRRTGASRRGP